MLRIIALLSFTWLAIGCSGVTSPEKSDSLGLVSTPDEAYSQWYYDSLPLCQIQGDELDQFVIPQTHDIWARIREQFVLEPTLNKRVQQELNWYVSHPSYMARVSKRAESYLFHIVEEVERRGIPMEFALLPIVESAYDPFAYSHGQASGIWQIIPGTGRMLGLKQNWWYDGRRDIVESTNAALNYLEKLNKQMDGDWLLALASYNSGAGNVRKAIRKNRNKSLAEDYWSLDLPKETEAYVPKLLALKLLIENPDTYSVKLHSVKNEPYFESIDVGSQIDVAQAAELAGVSMDQFYVLNPAFNRWATDPEGPHSLLIPVDKAEQFKQNISSIPESERVTWTRYKIKNGDSLSTIAANHNTTVDLLQTINDLKGVSIRSGKTLLVPQASASASHYTYSQAQRIKRKQSRGSGNKTHYVVRPGDSFWSIAKRYKVSTTKLAKWNGMAPKDPIRPGQKLVVWTKPNNTAGAKTVRKVGYKVRKGDSLARIASRFNLNVKDILAWNGVDPKKYLQPGDRLTLFVDVTNLH